MNTDQIYEEAVDNFLTGDIHLIPDSFLFDCIAKRGLEPLIEAGVNIRSVRDRRNRYNTGFKSHSLLTPNNPF